ncbi:MAG: glucose 1-dehydrogenase [Myxococcota bacterium]
MSTPQLFDLHGRTALVTGGGRGIGRWIALGLAEAGADVVVAGRKRGALESAVAEIEALGRRALALPTDLCVPQEVQALAAAALAFARPIDILVNNAARTWAAPTLDYPLEAWDRVMDLNLRGLWGLTAALAPAMCEAGRGSIVNLSSVSARRGGFEEEQPVVAYSASKGAVEALTTDLAIKFGPRGVRVNAIAPGPFDTDMMKHVTGDARAAHDAQVPLRRTGSAADIQGAVTFLASDAAAFVTGHTLVVDGGISALYPIR